MPKILNLIGETYNLLTVIKKGEGYIGPSGQKATTWICKCECGNITEASTGSLRSNNTKSCGCLKTNHKSRLTHGMTNTKEYRCWISMRKRCLNSNDASYENYGGRGIKVCNEWLNSFEAFYADVGKAPSAKHTLDRIDVNGNYEPSNVRWTTQQVQTINQRIGKNNPHGYKGVYWHEPLKQWVAKIGVNNKLVHLGYYDNKENAIAARLEAEKRYFQPLLESA